MAQMWPKRTTRIGNLNCLYQTRRKTHFQCRNPLEMAIEKGKKKVFQNHLHPSFNLLQAIQTIITSSQWKEAMRSSQAIPGRLGSQVTQDPKSKVSTPLSTKRKNKSPGPWHAHEDADKEISRLGGDRPWSLLQREEEPRRGNFCRHDLWVHRGLLQLQVIAR